MINVQEMEVLLPKHYFHFPFFNPKFPVEKTMSIFWKYPLTFNEQSFSFPFRLQTPTNGLLYLVLWSSMKSLEIINLAENVFFLHQL